MEKKYKTICPLCKHVYRPGEGSLITVCANAKCNKPKDMVNELVEE